MPEYNRTLILIVFGEPEIAVKDLGHYTWKCVWKVWGTHNKIYQRDSLECYKHELSSDMLTDDKLFLSPFLGYPQKSQTCW